MRRFLMWLFVASAWVVGCGESDPPALTPPLPDASEEDSGGGAGGDGGPGDAEIDATTEDGAAGDGGANDAAVIGGPTVSIITPTPSVDPATDTIHTGSSLEVSCTVEADPASPDPVDQASVVARVYAIDAPSVALAETFATPSGNATYHATLMGLDVLPTGAYLVECEAADSAAMPRVGSARVQVLHDGGARITIVEPAALAVVAQSQVLPVELVVESASLVPGDDGADVVLVSLVVAGIDIALTQSSTEPTLYSAGVNFLGGLFNPVPSGSILITVTATNDRGNVAVLSRQVVVDGTGPVITVLGTAHDDGDLVRGTQNIEVRIADMLAGVDPGSLNALVVDDEIALVPTGTANTYRLTFDTLAYDTSVTELPLVFRARDLAGNETTLARKLRLDNQPPLVTLDSPPVREYRQRVVMGTLALECSSAFDPLGSDTVNDGAVALEGAEFRARIQDQTNGVEGNGIVRVYATVANDRVGLYALTDLTRPLLIDTDGDGVCDEINDEATLQTLPMAPVTPRGTAYYGPGSSAGSDPAWPGWCNEAASMTSPTLVCAPSASSPLVRVIKAPLAGNLPAIWGMPPIDSLRCVGDYWDWRQAIPNGGPTCVAVRAEDTLGNVGVSRPLRVCLQRSSGGYDCSADTTFADHDCTSGSYEGASVSCQLPPAFPPEAAFVPFD